MTNFEYYKDEIKKIADTGRFIAFHNGMIVACRSIRCEDCEFEDRLASMFSSDCHKYMLQWLCKEHKETPILTAREWHLLKVLQHGEIHRDENNYIFWCPAPEIILSYCLTPKLCKGLFDFCKPDSTKFSVEEMLTWEHEEEEE